MELYNRRNAPKRADSWYVYGLVDSRKSEEIRYIGITNNPRSRLSLHLSKAPKEGWKKSRWIQSVIDAGGDVLMKIIDSGRSQDSAMLEEIALIAEHRRLGSKLMNLTDGGDGVRGQIKSAETRAKQSAAMKGVPKSLEARARMSEAQRGHATSEETKAKMRISHLLRYEDPAAKEVQRQGTKRRFDDPSERARSAVSTLSRFAREGEKERHSEIMQKFANDNPEVSKRRRETQIKNGPQSNNKSGFKGVFFERRRDKFAARIKADGRIIHLGYFAKAEEAAVTYDSAARTHFGEFAYFNFPMA